MDIAEMYPGIHNIAAGPKRPHHGHRQVRTLKGIREGNVFIWYNKRYGRIGRIRIVSEPFKKGETWWVNCEVNYNGEWCEDKVSLADRGVVCYEDGLWNTHNWLSRI